MLIRPYGATGGASAYGSPTGSANPFAVQFAKKKAMAGFRPPGLPQPPAPGMGGPGMGASPLLGGMMGAHPLAGAALAPGGAPLPGMGALVRGSAPNAAAAIAARFAAGHAPLGAAPHGMPGAVAPGMMAPGAMAQGAMAQGGPVGVTPNATTQTGSFGQSPSASGGRPTWPTGESYGQSYGQGHGGGQQGGGKPSPDDYQRRILDQMLGRGNTYNPMLLQMIRDLMAQSHARLGVNDKAAFLGPRMANIARQFSAARGNAFASTHARGINDSSYDAALQGTLYGQEGAAMANTIGQLYDTERARQDAARSQATSLLAGISGSNNQLAASIAAAMRAAEAQENANKPRGGNWFTDLINGAAGMFRFNL